MPSTMTKFSCRLAGAVALAAAALASSGARAEATKILFVGNSYTFGRIDPVMSYNAAQVHDLTASMYATNPSGANSFEPHPWGGVAGIFKQFTVQVGLDYDVSISARNAASLRGQFLNTNSAGWDLRGNIGSQAWDKVVLQEQSDEPLTKQPGLASNPAYFNTYANLIENWVHQGNALSYRERDLIGGTNAKCAEITGASTGTCSLLRTVGANAHANADADVYLYQTWARPNLVNAPSTTVTDETTGAVTPTGQPAPSFYPSLQAMTEDLRQAYAAAALMAGADGSGGIAGVAPVGEAFMRAIAAGIATPDMYASTAASDGLLDLWFDDGTHASKYGSYLSALTLFGTITGVDPSVLGLGEIAARDLGISARDAVLLQRVASEQLGFVAAVPEPGSFALAALGVALVGMLRWRQRWSTTPMMTALVLGLAAAAPVAVAKDAKAAQDAQEAAFDMAAESAPAPATCPSGVGEGARCLAGQDSAGAFYMIVMPKAWNGDLVVHAHGGPFLGAPTAKRVVEDIERWSIMPRLGYALAASSYRQGGVAVTAAAQDNERLRRLFIDKVAKPKHVYLHGQSWGASVAAKGAERFVDGKPYDAVLLSSGVLGGGTRSYDFRLDLRVVYQYLCRNHPLPSEPQYPLNIGLPLASTMKQADLASRVNDCLGLNKPAAERSPEQAAKIKTLVDVVHIPERSILSHLNWATWHFQDITFKRTGGTSPFGNVGAVYAGSSDDAALNAGVQRYAADPKAVAMLAADADLDGKIPVPVLTVHAIHDPTAMVELQESFGRTMAAAGRGDALVQTFTGDKDHSYLSDPTYAALMEALSNWATQGRKPTPASIAAGCEKARVTLGSTCRFEPDYQVRPLETRVVGRDRP